MDLRTVLSAKPIPLEDPSLPSAATKRTDPSFLEKDVYIVKVERTLFKIDEQALLAIPKLSIALKNDELHPGRPFELGVPCQPRVLKDILYLLKSQLSDLDPFDSFQSAQVDIDNETLRLVQQLQLADSLGLEKLGHTIVDKIRTLCANNNSLDEALRNTRFEKYTSLDTYSARIFGGRTCFSRNDETALGAPNILKIGSYHHGPTQSAKKTPRLKRKAYTHVDNSTTPDQISKKTKSISDGLHNEREPNSQHFSRALEPQNEFVLDPILDFTQTADSDKSQSQQGNSELYEEGWEVDDDGFGIKEDDFERDQDGIVVAEQDSFELDEDEVTSNDIEELVISDPVKFECIASPRTPRKNTKPDTDKILSSSPALPLPLYAEQSPVSTVERSSPRIKKADIGKIQDVNPSDMASLSFDLETFFCRGLGSEDRGSYALIYPDHLRVHYKSKTLRKTTLFRIDYTKILQFKIASEEEKTPIIQVLLRYRVLPSNICYLVFKTHADLNKFVTDTRYFFSNLRVITMASSSVKTALTVVSSSQSSNTEATTTTQPSPQSIDKNIDVVKSSEDDEIPGVDELLSPRHKSHLALQSSSPINNDSRTNTKPMSIIAKKKLFNRKL